MFRPTSKQLALIYSSLLKNFDFGIHYKVTSLLSAHGAYYPYSNRYLCIRIYCVYPVCKIICTADKGHVGEIFIPSFKSLHYVQLVVFQ